MLSQSAASYVSLAARFSAFSGIAATGALLFDMLMLSRGLVVSMEQLLSGVGFDIRVSATQATPLTGPPITNMADTVAALAALPEIEDVVPLRLGQAQVDIGQRSHEVSFMGADVRTRRPWTLVDGRDLTIDDCDHRRHGRWTSPRQSTTADPDKPEPGAASSISARVRS